MAAHPLLYLLKLLKGRTLPGAWIHLEILKKKKKTKQKTKETQSTVARPGSLVRQRFIYVSGSLPVIHHLLQPSEHPEESNDSLWAVIRAACQHKVQVVMVFTPAVQALGYSWKSMLTAAERNTALFFVARNL